jgi:multicomponent Na+:H+ antiporter subunit C
MSPALGLYNYWIVIFLMMTGFYIVISRGHLVKKIIGLNIFQVSVFLLYITMGKIVGGTPPILAEGFTVYSHPLPSVLILTAIVVGVATSAVALAIIVRIREAYGTVEEDEILSIERAEESSGREEGLVGGSEGVERETAGRGGSGHAGAGHGGSQHDGARSGDTEREAAERKDRES